MATADLSIDDNSTINKALLINTKTRKTEVQMIMITPNFKSQFEDSHTTVVVKNSNNKLPNKC